MDSTDNETPTALNDDQIEQIGAIVLDEFGPGLSRPQFNGVILGSFENIAGLETLTRKQVADYLRSLWVVYQRLVTSRRTALTEPRGPTIQSIVERCSTGTESLPLTATVLPPPQSHALDCLRRSGRQDEDHPTNLEATRYPR